MPAAPVRMLEGHDYDYDYDLPRLLLLVLLLLLYSSTTSIITITTTITITSATPSARLAQKGMRLRTQWGNSVGSAPLGSSAWRRQTSPRLALPAPCSSIQWPILCPRDLGHKIIRQLYRTTPFPLPSRRPAADSPS